MSLQILIKTIKKNDLLSCRVCSAVTSREVTNECFFPEKSCKTNIIFEINKEPMMAEEQLSFCQIEADPYLLQKINELSTHVFPSLKFKTCQINNFTSPLCLKTC